MIYLWTRLRSQGNTNIMTLRKILRVPASEELIAYVRDAVGGIQSLEWIERTKYCTCMNSDKLSNIMLAFWWLSNHTPGGKKGEGSVGCLKIIRFLSSSYHRIYIQFASETYHIHLQWIKISDRCSEIDITLKAITCLMMVRIRLHSNRFHIMTYKYMTMIMLVAKV